MPERSTTPLSPHRHPRCSSIPRLHTLNRLVGIFRSQLEGFVKVPEHLFSHEVPGSVTTMTTLVLLRLPSPLCHARVQCGTCEALKRFCMIATVDVAVLKMRSCKPIRGATRQVYPYPETPRLGTTIFPTAHVAWPGNCRSLPSAPFFSKLANLNPEASLRALFAVHPHALKIWGP